MIPFLIKSILCLGTLFGLYHFVLQKEKMHQFNRFYLIGTVMLSLLIPQVTLYIESGIQSPLNNIAQDNISAINISSILWVIYLIVVGVLLIRFIYNIIQLTQKVRHHETQQYYNATLVLVDEAILPHTFLNYIFINKEDYHRKTVKNELLTHELAHVTENHSWDILFLELTQIVFWFNPVLPYVKKAVRLNHEFIADDNVIATHNDVYAYQHILLDVANWKNMNCLTSNINYALTKSRFKMMRKKSSRKSILFSKVIILPVLLFTMFLFSNTSSSSNSYYEEHHRESHHEDGEEHFKRSEHHKETEEHHH